MNLNTNGVAQVGLVASGLMRDVLGGVLHDEYSDCIFGRCVVDVNKIELTEISYLPERHLYTHMVLLSNGAMTTYRSN